MHYIIKVINTNRHEHINQYYARWFKVYIVVTWINLFFIHKIAIKTASTCHIGSHKKWYFYTSLVLPSEVFNNKKQLRSYLFNFIHLLSVAFFIVLLCRSTTKYFDHYYGCGNGCTGHLFLLTNDSFIWLSPLQKKRWLILMYGN